MTAHCFDWGCKCGIYLPPISQLLYQRTLFPSTYKYLLNNKNNQSIIPADRTVLLNQCNCLVQKVRYRAFLPAAFFIKRYYAILMWLLCWHKNGHIKHKSSGVVYSRKLSCFETGYYYGGWPPRVLCLLAYYLSFTSIFLPTACLAAAIIMLRVCFCLDAMYIASFYIITIFITAATAITIGSCFLPHYYRQNTWCMAQ